MFNTNPILLSQLLGDVEAGKIQLPDFQRGWVWDNDRIRGLLASISRGFPIGAVMTLSAGGDIKFKPRLIEGVDGTRAQSANYFLLDGQQRLTTLFQALRYPEAVRTTDSKRKKTERWYYIDMVKALDPLVDREDAIVSVPKNKIETTDFGRVEKLNLSTPQQEYAQHLIPSEFLMNPMHWMLGYLDYWKTLSDSHPEGDALSFYTRFQSEVLDHFKDYMLPVINLGDQTPKEAVCTVFEKVNTGGIPLNVFELATASFAADAEHFSLRDDWDARKKRMQDASGVLQGVDGDQFLQTLTLLKTQEDRRNALQSGVAENQAPTVACKRKNILDLHLNDYLHWADRVEQGFIDAAKFLKTEYVFGRRNLPYNTQLVPLSALHVELGDELHPADAREKLGKWYWTGVFGEMYGGTIETQFALDLVEVANFIRGGSSPRLLTEASFLPERLITLKSRTSAAYKGVMAIQMKKGARDWISNVPLTIANFDEEHIDIHHVFPVAWCNKPEQRIPPRLYDSIINKTPIDAKTNRIIGGNAPSSYLPRINRALPDGNPDALEQVLSSHWFDITHLRNDDFATSFISRGAALMTLIGQAMGKDLGTGEAVFRSELGMPSLIEEYLDDEAEPDELAEGDYADVIVEAA